MNKKDAIDAAVRDGLICLGAGAFVTIAAICFLAWFLWMLLAKPSRPVALNLKYCPQCQTPHETPTKTLTLCQQCQERFGQAE